MPMGAWILTSREDGSEKFDLVSLPANWKRIEERRWKMTRDPQSNTVVWVDQDGEVKFSQPEAGTIMTFEERSLPPRGAGPQGVGNHYVPALERFHFGVDEGDLRLVVPECDEGPEQPEQGAGEVHLPETVDQDEEENANRSPRWRYHRSQTLHQSRRNARVHTPVRRRRPEARAP